MNCWWLHCGTICCTQAAEVSKVRSDIEAIKAQLMSFMGTRGNELDAGGADTQAVQQAKQLLDGVRVLQCV